MKRCPQTVTAMFAVACIVLWTPVIAEFNVEDLQLGKYIHTYFIVYYNLSTTFFIMLMFDFISISTIQIITVVSVSIFFKNLYNTFQQISQSKPKFGGRKR